MHARKKDAQRIHRHKRVRARIHGTAVRPRLVVFRSLKHIYAQLIDDAAGKTLLSATDKEIGAALHGSAAAAAVGDVLAQKAKKAGITNAVFDRAGYRYHGRVAALADAARKGGLAL